MSSIKVSVIVPCRNEAKHITQCVASVMEGSLPSQAVEVLVVDGMSDDGTRAAVQELHDRWPNVRLVDNPRKITPVALNLGIRQSQGEFICILGAHAYLSPNYLEVAVRKIQEQGADAVGGVMVTLNQNTSAMGRLIQTILSSRFGVGSSFRTCLNEGPTDTVVFGVYRREVFVKYGLFHEQLVRNQDNEFNSRLRAAGCRLWVTPEASSYYYSRPTMKKLLKQNFRNGLYGVLTWRINPASFTLRHAIPLGFVLFIMIGAVLGALYPLAAIPFAAMMATYLLVAFIIGLQTAIREMSALALLMPIFFLSLHVSYGLGTLSGLFRFGFAPLRPHSPLSVQETN